MNPTERATAFYQGQAGEAYHATKRGVPASSLPWLHRARAEIFQSLIRPDDSVLEWGCGAGWNIAALVARRRVGMDVEPGLQAQVEATGAEFVATTRTLASAAFDVIISHHSLEHAPDPLPSLIELGRLLRPEGHLLLAVPLEKSRAHWQYRADEPNHHLYAWNPQTLGNLVALSGLKVESVALRRYGYDRWAAATAVRFGLGEVGFRALRFVARTLRPLHEVCLHATRPTTPVRPTHEARW